MAVDRYLAVVNAINSRSYRTVRNSLIISILVWMVAILFSLQAYFLRTELLINDEKLNQTIHHCSWDFPGDDGSESYGFWLNFQYFTRTGFAFIVPIIIIGPFWKTSTTSQSCSYKTIIVYCYMSIYMFLKKRRKAQCSGSNQARNWYLAHWLFIWSRNKVVKCWHWRSEQEQAKETNW